VGWVVLSNLWVAGGLSIYYSKDGSTWTKTPSTVFPTNCTGASYSTYYGIWVGVGFGGSHTLGYSADAITWTGLGKGIIDTIGWGVGYSTIQNMWVAVGQGTVNNLAYSNNGITWTGTGTGVLSTESRGIACSNTTPNVWVATGQGTNSLAYSTNAITWTGVVTTGFALTVAYNPNETLWVAGGVSAYLYYSNNAITWTSITSAIATSLEYIAYSSNQNVWVAGGSGTNSIAYSRNAITWTGIAGSTSIFSTYGLGVTYNNTQDLWIMAGLGTNTAAYSKNGFNWTGLGTAGGAFTTTLRIVASVNSILNLTITTVSTTSFTVSWPNWLVTATAYTYYLNGTSTTPSIDNGVASKSATFTGLTAGNRYSVYIKATTAGGDMWSITRPTDISGCILWLDGADKSTVTTSASSVTQWTDKSINAYPFVQYSSSATPTVANISGTDTTQLIKFSGNNILSCATAVLPKAPYTIFVHGNNTNTANYCYFIGCYTDIYLFVGTHTGTTNLMAACGNGAAWNNLSPMSTQISVAALSTISVTNDNTTFTAYVNSTSAGTKGGTSNATTGLIIGGRGSTECVTGSMNEVVIYNSVLSTTNRQYIEGYLAWKFGSQAALVAGHPYKSVAPTGMGVWNP